MDAAGEYQQRLTAHRAAAERARRDDLALGIAKLTLAFVLLVVAWLALVNHFFGAIWILLPIAILAVLAVAHERACERRGRANRCVALFERALARVEDRWQGLGPTGAEFLRPEHLYAADLDLFGEASLFQRLCEARTPMGQAKLAGWMTTFEAVDATRARQRRVAELSSKLELREQLASIGDELKSKLDPKRLAEWAIAAPSFGNLGLQFLLPIPVVAALGAAVYWAGTGHAGPFLLLLGLEAVLTTRLLPRSTKAVTSLGSNSEGLRLFARVAATVEGYDGSNHGSHALRSLAHLAEWIDAAGSFLIKLLEIPLLYTPQLALAAERWRRRHGPAVAAWLDAVATHEAHLSLAAYAFEHADDPFPVFDEGPGVNWRGDQLRHPLQPSAICVPNDVHLSAAPRILMISGSNMAGKSTLLRTVGINTVLAQLGLPARAASLTLTPVALGACLRIGDSLQEGRSGFYSEILRLHAVAELMCGPRPLLFLFDEMLDGTNSQDRVAGGAALLRALLQGGAAGLVTTHDYALADVAAGMVPQVMNLHFEDTIVDGRPHFDHRLREGPATRGNALELMRLIGLDV